MSKSSHIIPIAMLVVAIAFFNSGCKEEKNFLKETTTLDSLSQLLANRIDTVKVILMDSLPSFQDSVKSHIAVIQRAYSAQMPEQTAQQISNYYQTLSRCEQPTENALNMLQELAVCQNQVDSLYSLIVRKAERDGMGNNITPAYIEAAIQAETTRSSRILQTSQRFISDYGLAKATFLQYRDTISDIISKLNQK